MEDQTGKFSTEQTEAHRQHILKLLSDISSSLKTLVFYGAGDTPETHPVAMLQQHTNQN